MSYQHQGGLYRDMGAAKPPKQVLTAYLLWFFFGGIGVHKFYLGRPKMGILYIFTLGLFFIGWIYDAFTMSAQVDRANAEMAAAAGAGDAGTAE